MKPKYLRVRLLSACPLSCSFCHREGASKEISSMEKLSPSVLVQHIQDCVNIGIRKVKFLGGEPLLYKKLPYVVSKLRQQNPDLDISIITSGSLPVPKLENLFDAGLSRANISIHGWDFEHFQAHGGNKMQFQYRFENLQYLIRARYPTKINYVLSDSECHDDLRSFLHAMAPLPVVVSVLNDLNKPQINAGTIADVLHQLCGPWEDIRTDHDPYSLSTTQLIWTSGLVVELKTKELNQVQPWTSCKTCPQQQRCREGIFAIRLTEQGSIQLCMDRPDLSLPLSKNNNNLKIHYFLIQNQAA